jgi:ABC-type uncharacterized transport system substrate-binding protein
LGGPGRHENDDANSPLQIAVNAVNRLLEIFRVWSPITIVLAALLLAAPLAAEAQAADPVRRIGVLGNSRTGPEVDGFQQGLRDHGYVEGRNLLVEWRFVEGREDRLRGFADELASRKVELIVGAVGLAAIAAKNATTTIPIVFMLAPDPVASGLVARAMVLAPGLFVFANRVRLAELATKSRLPLMGWQRELAKSGAFVSYGPNHFEIGRLAAGYVDKILRGVKPGDLPVQQPTQFELVINRRTAKALGLTIPPSVLLRADQIIE